jgi:hypothetical protein
VVENPFYYTTNAGAITILSLTENVVDMTIPASIDGLPVTCIADFAFVSCSSLASVTIPGGVTSIGANAFALCNSLTNASIGNGVTSIGQGAFNDCTGLVSVKIPASVTSIGPSAFADCSGLASVMIPASVTNIGGEAFTGCTSLPAIIMDARNPFYSSADGVLFDKGQTTLIEYPGARAGDYTIPESVASIGSGAFANCAGLTGIRIPGSVTSIGDSAFEECTSLTSVIMPGSVTNIGGNAFYACVSLTNVYFTGNAPTADSSIFGGYEVCQPVPVTVYYLPGTTGWSNTFAGVPALLWNPLIQTGHGSFGVRDNQFGFNITGTNNFTVVVEACTNLVNPVWVPLTTNTLIHGLFHFSEPVQENTSGRFYGLGLP